MGRGEGKEMGKVFRLSRTRGIFSSQLISKNIHLEAREFDFGLIRESDLQSFSFLSIIENSKEIIASND
jgi:hypothetical protein